ncbi:MAG: FG-GAP-like repeat-containing protein, partial [Pseudomonadota bacterium]
MTRCRILAGLCALILLTACSKPADEISDEDIALNNRGVALMGYFDYPGAHATFSELVERKPNWHDARTNLAIAFMNRQETGDEQRALDELAKVLADNPDDPRANYVTGLLQLYIGEIEPAATSFERVLALDPDDAYAHYYLGQCQQRLGDRDSALAHYRTAIDKEPYLRSAYYNAAQVLQQQGDADAATEQLELFQRFATNPRAELAEFKYTRMGPKSLARVAGESENSEKMESPSGRLFGEPRVLSNLEEIWTGAHTTVADINNDGKLEILIAGPTGNLLLVADGDGYESAAIQPFLGVDKISAVAWGDVDNNGFVDAYFCRDGDNQLWYQLAAGNWQASDAANDDNHCNDVALVDADHDGDLDIVIANADAPYDILNNNRDGSFRSLRDRLPGGNEGRSTRTVIAADFDNDRDVDLMFLHEDGPSTLLINDRLWRYRPAEEFSEFSSLDFVAAAVVDLDANGGVEFVGVWDNGVVRSWQYTPGSGWHSSFRTISQIQSRDVQIDFLDLDGDGVLEMALFGDNRFEIYAFGAGADTDDETTVDRVSGGLWYGGATALLAPTRGHSVLYLTGDKKLVELPPGPGRHDFVSFTLSGDHDEAETMRSNASGIGTQVALRVGSRWTLTDTYKNSSTAGQSLQPVAIGLGGAPRADFVELQWSDGVYQTELDIEPGDVHHFAEVERQLSSCPVLFAWDGESYNFVTDLLGVGGLGGFVAPGVAGTPRPWERLAIPPGVLADADGVLQFKLSEPMQENMYLDAVSIESYDLPDGWHITVDERMGTGAPDVTGKTFFYRDTLTPIAATDSDGDDVLDAVATKDNVAMSPGNIDRRFLGLLTEVESVTLEFDQPITEMSSARLPILVTDSWVEYPYSQTAFAAWQANLQYQSATLEARDVEGKWHTVYDNFGYPAGMPREMTLPLPTLPAGADALRLSWNRELYWDR